MDRRQYLAHLPDCSTKARSELVCDHARVNLDRELPIDARLELDRSVRRIDGGSALIGGSPTRIIRLSAPGSRLVDRWVAGESIGEGVGARSLARRMLDYGFAHPRIDLTGDALSNSVVRAADVTVVIPVIGSGDALARTLTALAGSVPKPAAIIVVDDGSAPADARHIAEVSVAAGAQVVRRVENGGPASARNQGLASVRTGLVAFVDCDVEPSPHWLRWLLPHFDDPTVGAVAPRIWSVAPTDEHSGEHLGQRSGQRARRSRRLAGTGVIARYDQIRSPLDLGQEAARVAPRTRVSYVPTAAMIVRVDALVDVGLFDPELRFGEDVDLVWRLVEADWTIRYEPRATATHPSRAQFGSWLAQRFHYGTSAAPLAVRHPDELAPLTMSVWTASAWCLAALGYPKAGTAVALTAISQLPQRLTGLEHPTTEAFRLAGGGTWAGWRPLASAVTRTWWPAAVGASILSKRARRALVFAVAAPALIDWWTSDRAVDPLRFVALHLADDLAYGAGVWAGCMRERTAEPLRPDLKSWPGRSDITGD